MSEARRFIRRRVLVAPFGRIDRFVRKVPIVRYVIGGTLTSIPVGVRGDLRNPLLVPLGPSAITSELTGIFSRTLKLPTKLLPAPGAIALTRILRAPNSFASTLVTVSTAPLVAE